MCVNTKFHGDRGHAVAEIWRFLMDFLKFKISTVKRFKGSICIPIPNFVAIGRTVTEIWRFFDFFKIAAVRHLGFVMRVFGPPTKTR